MVIELELGILLQHSDQPKEPRIINDCKDMERPFHKSGSMKEQPSHPNNFGSLSNRPVAHTNAGPVSTSSLESQMPHNPFTKYLQEIALTNPYDHPDNGIFRDPDVFPPFNIQQQMHSGQLPLPLKNPHEEDNEKYYPMQIGQNTSNGIIHPYDGKFTSRSNKAIVCFDF